MASICDIVLYIFIYQVVIPLPLLPRLLLACSLCLYHPCPLRLFVFFFLVLYVFFLVLFVVFLVLFIGLLRAPLPLPFPLFHHPLRLLPPLPPCSLRLLPRPLGPFHVLLPSPGRLLLDSFPSFSLLTTIILILVIFLSFANQEDVSV